MEGTSAWTRWRLTRVLLAGGVLAAGWLVVDLAVNAESATAAPQDAIGDLLDDDGVVSAVLSVVDAVVVAPVAEPVIDAVVPVVDVPVVDVPLVLDPAVSTSSTRSTGSAVSAVSTGSTTEHVAPAEPAPATPPSRPLESPTPPAAAASVGEVNSGIVFAVYAHPAASSTQQRPPASPTFDSDTTPD